MDGKKQMNELPDKKYNIIYADPPWAYQTAVKRTHYQRMKTQNICDLQVKDISDDNCVLFIWGTWTHVEDVQRVIKTWGFEYKTCAFLWYKKTKNNKAFFGMGSYTRANSEFCLIAMKGKLKRVNASIRQVIESEIEKHSKKPDEVRNNIVELYGDLPRIELFAREKSEGWDSWGNEL